MITRTNGLAVICFGAALAAPTVETLTSVRLAELLSKCAASGGGICEQVDREVAILPHTETSST
jgi:hypothetical protein